MANLTAMIKSWFSRLVSYLMSPFRFMRPRPPEPPRSHYPHKSRFEDNDSDEEDAECFETSRSHYHMGRTLGAGTYGIVREADCNEGKVAVKIILKKSVKGNEQMVYDELQMLQKLHHPHIVRFHDWFESRVSRRPGPSHYHDSMLTTMQDKFYIVTQLAWGGELFDRICEKGRFTEKDAAVTIRQVFDAVNYLHQRQIVHRGRFSGYHLKITFTDTCRSQTRESPLPYQRKRLSPRVG